MAYLEIKNFLFATNNDGGEAVQTIFAVCTRVRPVTLSDYLIFILLYITYWHDIIWRFSCDGILTECVSVLFMSYYIIYIFIYVDLNLSSLAVWYRKMGWLEPIFGIFDISYLTGTTQPLDTQNIWHCALTQLIKKTRNFRSPSLQVFLSLQTWKFAISEMGSFGPILDSKLIPLVPFFTGAIAEHMNYWSTKNYTKWFSSNWTFHLHKKVFISPLK